MITTDPTDPETVEWITVTVRDRSREAPWGVGLTSPVIRQVHISAFCPNCGARRGERSWLTTFADGERYWTETWSCSAGCGHVDHYANVVAEAERIAATQSDQSPPVGLVDVVAGPHTIVALGEDCLVCEEGLEPGAVYVFCRAATGSGVAHESCTDHSGPDHTNRALPR